MRTSPEYLRGKEFLIGTAIAITLIAGMIVWINYQDSARRKTDALEKEFVCYTDGKLVERHVGLHSAYLADQNIWRLTYVEGQQGFYLQASGETCQIEVIK